MYELLYVEINVICMIILLYILYKTHSSIDKRAETVVFNKVVIATLVILVVDIAWMLADGIPGQFFYWFNVVMNTAYLFIAGVICYLWFVFVNYKLKGNDVSIKYLKLMAIPMVALLILCLISPWTKTIFYIDELNCYRRNPMTYFIHPIVSYSYVAIASLQVLLHFKKAQTQQRKTELLTLFSFFILPVVGATLCIIVYGLPTSWPCTTLSLLMVYINFQSYQISTDSLTELNNRRQFDKYFSSAIADVHKSKRLFLFIMDIDAFKSINDTFGHLSGDAALIQTASILRDVCRGRNAFLARYGGDEFAILYFCEKTSDAKHFKTCIQSEFIRYNNEKVVPYSLTLSIGMAEYVQSLTQNELIAAADKALYIAKTKRKDMER